MKVIDRGDDSIYLVLGRPTPDEPFGVQLTIGADSKTHADLRGRNRETTMSCREARRLAISLLEMADEAEDFPAKNSN